RPTRPNCEALAGAVRAIPVTNTKTPSRNLLSVTTSSFQDINSSLREARQQVPPARAPEPAFHAVVAYFNRPWGSAQVPGGETISGSGGRKAVKSTPPAACGWEERSTRRRGCHLHLPVIALRID